MKVVDSLVPSVTMRKRSQTKHIELRLWWLCILVACLLPGALQATAEVKTIDVEQGAQFPSLSPSGETVAVSILGKIWLISCRAGEAVKLSEGFSWDTHPAWSPSSRFVAYAQQTADGSDLVSVNLTTGQRSVLFHSQDQIGQIAFAHSSKSMFFIVQHDQYEAHLWRLSLTGENPKAITGTKGWHEWSFAVGPDDKQIFITSGHIGGSLLYSFELNTSASSSITQGTASYSSVATGDNGKKLVYIETQDGRETVFVREWPNGAARAVFSSPYDDKAISVSETGQWGVLCAGRKLYRLDLSSGRREPIPFKVRLPVATADGANLAIIHARVVTMDSGVLSDSTILVHDGRIASISAANKIDYSSSVPVIDATGKTVMPGLVDNHYHFWNIFDGPRLLRHGVTSIRDPGSELSTTLNYKDAIRLGLAMGPDLYTCGPLLDGVGGYHPAVDVELDGTENIRTLIESLKEQGVDAIKVYFMLRPEVLKTIVQEAHRVGLRVTGHLGVKTSWSEAIDYGIDGLNHLRIWRDFLPPEDQPSGDGDSLGHTTNAFARMQWDWRKVDIDGPEVERLIHNMAEKKVALDPTLALQRVSDSAQESLNVEQFSAALSTYTKMKQFVKKAENAGVLILAGTDNGDLQDELEAYVDAGLSPSDILRAATLNGARWLGKDADFGSVAVGRQADLLIVDGYPDHDIRDLRKIVTVIKAGRVAVEE